VHACFLVLGDAAVERTEFSFSRKLVEDLLEGGLTARVYLDGKLSTAL